MVCPPLAALLEQHVHHTEVAAGAGEGERCVVVVGGLPVEVRAPGDEELDGVEMAGPQGLHQGGAP